MPWTSVIVLFIVCHHAFPRLSVLMKDPQPLLAASCPAKCLTNRQLC